MANIIIYGIIVITSLLLYFVKQRYGYWKKLGVPHEEPRLFMGNAQGLMKTRSLGDLFLHTYEKFKGTAPFCGFYMLFKPMAVILDINLVKNVLIKDFSNFTDHGFYTNVEDDPLTGHLFSLEGQKWKTMRTKLTPTFTSGKMKFMFPTILKVADEFVQVFDEMLDKNGNEIEVKEFLARFTTDVIGTCAFGIECNSLRDPNAEFRKMGKATFTERRHGAMGTMIINSFPNLAKKLHMKITTDKVEKFFMNIVRETVDYRRKHNIQRNDFLNILMDLNKESKGDDALTLEEMAAQAFVFFLAGFETSSSTMSFALYELAMHQQEQDRLRKEILETEEKYGLTYESIKSITYLNMVIQETLRKHPIVPTLNRKAINDYVVPGNSKFIIKKGTDVVISVIGIHHDAEFYPDPEKWNPDRFSPEQVKERDSVLWLSFGDGPRACIGNRFGEMQTRVGLAYLIKNFKFSPCSKTEKTLIFDKTQFVRTTLNGIVLKVERINN